MTHPSRIDSRCGGRSLTRLCGTSVGIVSLLWIGACGTSAAIRDTEPTLRVDAGTPTPTPVIDTCTAGTQGCACTSEGATASCGRVHTTDGNYVTCSVGYATCHDGVWGQCVGDHFVTRSVPGVVMTASGIRTLDQIHAACTNICDPNGCMSTQDSPTDVDAAGVALGPEGGVTLQFGVIEAGTTNGNPNCAGLACSIANCTGGKSTTLSGTVYDPAGNDPLYNAYVYIPVNPTAALPAFGSGASCDTCGGAGSLNALQAVQTDAAGNFTLTNVPTVANLPVVVQMGKWRREIVLKSITSCQNNTITNNCTSSNPADCVFRLPRNHADGYDPVAGTYTKADLPHVAIVTGSADPFDCLLLKAGVDPAEFGDYTSTKRFHFYEADQGGGNTLDPAYGMNVPGSTLWNNLNGTGSNMMSYDVILLPCQGGAYNAETSGNTPYQNLVTYTDLGGRAFMTHFSYSWLEYPAGKSYVAAPDNWSNVANWSPTGASMTSTVDTQDPLIGVVNTSFPKGAVYSQWLQNVNASSAPAQVTIHEGRQDLTTMGPNPQPWMTAHDNVYATAPDYTNLYTFNTPLGAAASSQCGRVVYSDFHVSASALVGGTNQCLSNADCGFTATCSGAQASALGSCSEQCGTNADCPNSSYACTGTKAGTCTETTCTSNSQCGSGRPCVGGVCACTSNADCNGGGCSAGTCTPIACTSSAQCGKGTCAGGTCNSVACHSNADCGLGTCGGAGKTGICTAGVACHANADCPMGGTCGSGTSSTKGTCSTSSAVCHKNADCDSNSCGSGTGSATGTCSSSGQACHASSACDSGSCSGGICSSGTGHACHSNSGCDGANCGGGTKGTCLIGGGAPCHVNGDCDSNSCGAGTGSTAGVCSTKGIACTKNSQCDSGSCSGGFCTAKACAGNSQCGVSGLCNGATCSTPAACSADSSCVKSLTCNGATCGAAPSCGADTACTASHLCNGAKCSTKSCTADASCTASQLCNGAKCSTVSCSVDTNCSASQLCNGAKCSEPCNVDTDCPSGATCNGAKCTPPAACGSNTDCGTGGTCSGAKCSASACGSNADCGAGSLCAGTCQPASCTKDTDCASGICTGGVCGCASGENCGGAQTCTGAVPGVCGRTCTQDSDCAPDFCINGKCGGCTNSTQCHDNAFAASCGGVPSTSYGTCTPFGNGKFPEACRQGALSPQEKALEFMFFDLTSCVSPDNALPPSLSTQIQGFPPATFSQDFVASCPPMTVPVWREFDWQAQVPSGAAIVISAQSGLDAGSLLPPIPVLVATATKSTAVGPTGQNFDAALIDTGPKGTGAFDVVNPQVISRNLLRVTITLDPTSDFQQSPTLDQWKVQYDCVASE